MKENRDSDCLRFMSDLSRKNQRLSTVNSTAARNVYLWLSEGGLKTYCRLFIAGKSSEMQSGQNMKEESGLMLLTEKSRLKYRKSSFIKR